VALFHTAGLDKFFNLLVTWEKYLSPRVVGLLPVTPAIFMAACTLARLTEARSRLAGSLDGWRMAA
jgi:hypothetical protein